MNSIKPKWWQDTVFYEVYISSFQDGNNDGIGDFVGLTQRLDYLQELGVNGLWITPFYPSPKVDNGYDVANYRDVDPDFGTLDDFDYFMKEAHKRGIKVIIDVVLNHVSSDHEWFKEAITDPKSKYRDYFIFADKTNNWESFFGGTAWQQEPHGEQYYYHQFAPEQVDLNWQNPAVKDEMIDVLKFWLDRGVDGFRFDVINFLTCDGILQDNPVDDKGEQIHLYDIDQNSIFDNVKLISAAVRDYGLSIGKQPFLVGEVGHDELAKLVPYQGDELLDVVFNFNLGSIESFDISNVHQQLMAMDTQLSGLPTIFFNSHDMPRSMSRLCDDNDDQAFALAALALTAKGVNFLYFGEEIGLPNFMPKNIEDIRDIKAINHFELAKNQHKNDQQAYQKALQETRDKSRLYMQWDENKYAGFSDVTPWIGREKEHDMPCVSAQQDNPNSLWHWYKKLIQLRHQSPVLKYGNYESVELVGNLLYLSRSYQGQKINIYINFSKKEQKITLSNKTTIIVSCGFDDRETSLNSYGVLIIKEQNQREKS